MFTLPGKIDSNEFSHILISITPWDYYLDAYSKFLWCFFPSKQLNFYWKFLFQYCSNGRKLYLICLDTSYQHDL